MVQGLGVPVKIEKTEDWVPSFMEKWVWFQVTRLEGDIKEEAQVVNGEAEPGNEEKLEAKSDDKEKEKDPAAETKKEPVPADKKEEKKEEKKDEKKDEKKEAKGAKEVKDQLEKGKEKGLTKEKSNVDKKTKKTK